MRKPLWQVQDADQPESRNARYRRLALLAITALLCAGILLHIGFSMLIKEFPADTAKVAVGAGAGLKRAAMLAALWGGAGAMAALGRWL